MLENAISNKEFFWLGWGIKAIFFGINVFQYLQESFFLGRKFFFTSAREFFSAGMNGLSFACFWLVG